MRKKPNAFDAMCIYEDYIKSCKQYWVLAKTIKLIIRFSKVYPDYPEYTKCLRRLRYDRLVVMNPSLEYSDNQEITNEICIK